jgi:hypothetical protein
MLLDWIAGLLFAGALAMTALSAKEIKQARAIVGFAAAIFIFRWIMWGFTTDQPLGIRVLVGACAGAFLLGILPPSLRWIKNRGKEAETTNEAVKAEPALPVDTLRYVVAKMELGVKSELKKGAGRIAVELHNDSDRLIKFHAVTAGNINGVAFDFNKVEFDGYIYSHQSTYLVSNRISDIPLTEQADLETPSVTGIYEYDLSYGDAREIGFSRRTAKGVRIAIWFPIMGNPKGMTIEKPTRVLLYNEIEE